MNKLRIVVDVNVIISSLLFANSKPRKALDIIRQNHFILMSENTLLELEQVLNRPKFNKYITLEERQDFLTQLLEKVFLVEINESINECRDPKDNKYLELAVSGKANYLITGDEDLLVLNPFRTIEIIKVDNFLGLQL
jgi:uncharacterized protein